MKRNDKLRSGKVASAHNRGQFLLVLMAFATGYMSSTIINMNQLESWLNQLVNTWFSQPAKIGQTPTANAVALAPSQPSPKLEFYTVLTQDDKPLLPKPKMVAATNVEPKAEQTLLKASVAAAIETSKNEPLAKTNIEQVPMSTPKGNYVVQLASFRYVSQAQGFRDKLEAKGFHVKISAIRQGPMQWYRVMLGPYTSIAEAQKAKLIFQAKEHGTGMIRQMDA